MTYAPEAPCLMTEYEELQAERRIVAERLRRQRARAARRANRRGGSRWPLVLAGLAFALGAVAAIAAWVVA